MNRVVYDSVDAAPTKLNEEDAAAASEETKGSAAADGEIEEGSTAK